MERQTKNVITRELIERELRYYNTANIRSALVLCAALSPLFVPLTVGTVCGVFALLKNTLLIILLSVLIGGLASAPIWIKLLALIRSLRDRKLIQNGDFAIVICEVQYKGEKPVHRHTEKFLHFNEFEEVLVENVNYDIVSQGDEFYIVHYKGHTTIKLLYSLKMYEYREMQQDQKR